MRFGCLTFVLLVLCVILISCTKKIPDFEVIDVKKPIANNEENPQKEEMLADELSEKQDSFNKYMWAVNNKYYKKTEALSQKEKITDFLDALSLGKIDLVDHYLNGWGHEDFKDLKLTYEILSIDEPNEYDDCSASVLLNVTESNSSAFPLGEHVYNLISRYIPDPCYITITKSDRDISDNMPEKRDKKLNDALLFGDRYLDFCISITKEYPNFYCIKELLKLELYEKFIVKNGGFTIEELRGYIKARFGGDDESYPEIEEMFAPSFNEESGMYVYSYGQDGWLQARRISQVEKIENGYNITYECFSDMSYLQKCMEITLVFEENLNSDLMRLKKIDRNIILDVPMKTYTP